MTLIYWRIIKRPRSRLGNGARDPRLDVDVIRCGPPERVTQEVYRAARYKGFVRVWDVSRDRKGARV